MDCSICVHKIKLMIFKISKQLTSNLNASINIKRVGASTLAGKVVRATSVA